MIQIENKEGEQFRKMLKQNKVDAVMIGPYDLSGSLGVPGDLDNKRKNSCLEVSKICKSYNVSGIQINDDY